MGLRNIIRNLSRDKGVFISVEGTDGSGKRTQIEKLIERLEKEGYVNLKLSDFPQYGQSSAYEVEEFLRGNREEGEGLVDVLKITNYFAKDRRAAGPMLHDWLNKGNIILSNRYIDSNKAFQGARINSNFLTSIYHSFVNFLEYTVYDIPRKDITLLLDVTPEISQALVDKKGDREYVGGNKRDKNEEDLGLQRRTRDTYLKLAEKENWILIDCMQEGKLLGPDIIADKIYSEIKPYLPEP